MFDRLSNWKFAGVVVIFLVVAGLVVGKLFGLLVEKISLVTYGYIAFAVLPITICLFGLKELNSFYGNVAEKLTTRERQKLRMLIDKQLHGAIVLGFGIVLIQILLAFSLNFSQDSVFFTYILGTLLGATLSVLIYGLFICSAVRQVYVSSNKLLDQSIKEKQNKKLLKEIKEDQYL